VRAEISILPAAPQRLTQPAWLSRAVRRASRWALVSIEPVSPEEGVCVALALEGPQMIYANLARAGGQPAPTSSR
jgi:hypothetical protein